MYLVTIVYLKGGQNLYMKQRNSNQQSIQRSTFWMVPPFPSPVTHHSQNAFMPIEQMLHFLEALIRMSHPNCQHPPIKMSVFNVAFAQSPRLCVCVCVCVFSLKGFSFLFVQLKGIQLCETNEKNLFLCLHFIKWRPYYQCIMHI